MIMLFLNLECVYIVYFYIDVKSLNLRIDFNYIYTF